MNTTFIAMGLAIVIGVGLLLGIGALSLLSGALNFLFVKPKIQFYKSAFGAHGLAFSFAWDQGAEPATYDRIKIHLLNPFGTPAQVEIIRQFEPASEDFVRDVELGKQFAEILNAQGLEKASIDVEILSKDQIAFTKNFKAVNFKSSIHSAAEFKGGIAAAAAVSSTATSAQVVNAIPERSFIAPALPKANKTVLVPTNPEFVKSFIGENASGGAGAATSGSDGASSAAQFAVTKVWIEPGCIVCNACEGIFPEVFEVTSTNCIIRPNAPLNDGLKIQEASDGCPVEVIKFTKAG